MINEQNEIIKHHQHTLEFVHSLSKISEEQWRSKVGENKWSVAEIIGHLIPWDEFVLNKRLPSLFSAQELPKGPDVEIINTTSAHKAREQEKKTTINNFISIRSELQKKIEKIPTEYWKEEITIGQTKLSLFEYLEGLALHDRHHFNQVKEIINER